MKQNSESATAKLSPARQSGPGKKPLADMLRASAWGHALSAPEMDRVGRETIDRVIATAIQTSHGTSQA